MSLSATISGMSLTPPVTDLRLPEFAFSPVFTDDVIGIPLHVTTAAIVAWVGYVRRDIVPASLQATAPTMRLLGTDFLRVSTLPTEAFAACLAGSATARNLPGLGKLSGIDPAHVRRWIPSRSPQLAAANTDTLDLLAATLDLPRAYLGLTGSTLYRPPRERSDVDFVVYGHAASRQAARRVRVLLPTPAEAYRKDGIVQHLRFRIPGCPLWFDPRFAVPDPVIEPLIHDQVTWHAPATLNGLTIQDDSQGIYHPARYRLSDGTVLASYRLGHSAYFSTGDILGDTRLPVADIAGTRYRLCLGQESIDRRPQSTAAGPANMQR
jgi:hypothetical protein